MIIRYEPVGRAVFARYDDKTSKLVCVCEFDDDNNPYGFPYQTAIQNAELIAELLNKSLI